MIFKSFPILVVTVLCFNTWTIPVYAEPDSAVLDPVDPVKKFGDKLQFKCRSPATYTGAHFESIEFKLEHNGTVIYGKVEADSVIDVYSIARFQEIPIASKLDAGNYTCIVKPSGDGKVASAESVLSVVKGNEMTQFGEMGKETKISCLGISDHLNIPFITVWRVDGKNVKQTPESSTLTFPKTEKKDAFKRISCLVTSEKAMSTYGNIANATMKGAVAEIHRSLSVLEVFDCKERTTPCALEVLVYGETPVNISWLVDGELHSPELTVEKNMTRRRSKTALLNLTSTTAIELRISDGHNIWRKNMTQSQVAPKEGPSPDGGAIVGAVLGSLAGVAVIIGGVLLYYYCFIKKRRDKEQKDELVMNIASITRESQKETQNGL